MARRAQDIGVMRERITINSKTTVKNASGYLTPTTTAVATVWGKVVLDTGARQEIGAQIVENQPYVITIRYRSDLDPGAANELTKKYTLTWNGLELTISAIKYIDVKRRFIEIKAYGQD